MLKAAEFFVGGQQLVRLNEKVIGEVSKDHGMPQKWGSCCFSPEILP